MAEEISRADCPCCQNRGALPGPWIRDAYGRVLNQGVPGNVVVTLCTQCVGALAGFNEHGHDLSGLRRSAREAGLG